MTTGKDRFRIEYDNNVGIDDDYFIEMWNVYEGDHKLCTCTKEEDAERIRKALKKQRK